MNHEVTSSPAAGISPARALIDVRPSTLVELLTAAGGADVISFAIGMPAAELFPLTAMSESCDRVLSASNSLQYGLPSRSLQSHIVELMARRGVHCSEEQIFLTTGGQQAMDLMVRLLLDPRGEVMIEEIVYEGIRLAMRPLSPRVQAVPVSPDFGIDVEAVERRLAEGAKPAFLYTIPEAHNPLGARLSLEHRLHLVELARRYRLPILEDDAYGFLSFEAEHVPALRALDDSWVFYLGSFSKILAPALRIGWIVTPVELTSRLATLKHGMDIVSATFAQRVVADFLDHNDFPTHIEGLRREYRHREATLAEALSRHLPSFVRWSRPSGGFYTWLELPAGLDATELLRHALAEESVAFTPGEAFALAGHRRAARSLRLSYASVAADRIEEGVIRLSRAIASWATAHAAA